MSNTDSRLIRPHAADLSDKDFIPICLDSLRVDSVLEFDLHVKFEGEFVLYRASHMPFLEKTRRLLIENGVKYLYIAPQDKKGYQQYIEANLSSVINDEHVPDSTKAEIIYESAKLLIKDALEKPHDKQNIQRSMDLVETTTIHILKNQKAFYYLLQTMSFDYSIYSHSINVCTFALALAQYTGITDKNKLFQIGTGALLHDIGKSRVPIEILNKNGPLTEFEMDTIKKHPQYGFEIVLKTDIIPHESHYPIIQHHERLDGSGYPHKLKADEIHEYGKIVAIADVFDAMTTRRSYRDAKDTFPALKEMYEYADVYDRELLDQFTKLMGMVNKE